MVGMTSFFASFLGMDFKELMLSVKVDRFLEIPARRWTRKLGLGSLGRLEGLVVCLLSSSVLVLVIPNIRPGPELYAKTSYREFQARDWPERSFLAISIVSYEHPVSTKLREQSFGAYVKWLSGSCRILEWLSLLLTNS